MNKSYVNVGLKPLSGGVTASMPWWTWWGRCKMTAVHLWNPWSEKDTSSLWGRVEGTHCDMMLRSCYMKKIWLYLRSFYMRVWLYLLSFYLRMWFHLSMAHFTWAWQTLLEHGTLYLSMADITWGLFYLSVFYFSGWDFV